MRFHRTHHRPVEQFEPRRLLANTVGCSLLAFLLCTCAAAQATVTLTFSGTYDITDYGTSGIFGLSGPAVPFSYQITYDPALDTNTFFFPTGATLDGATTTHEWYGYSASGITATNLTFGTQTWTVADMVARDVDFGIGADLWFDTDISLSTPTRCWMAFVDVLSFLEFGNAGSGLEIEIYNITGIRDHSREAYSPMTITSTVPEPGTMALAGFAAAGLLSLRRRKSNHAPA